MGNRELDRPVRLSVLDRLIGGGDADAAEREAAEGWGAAAHARSVAALKDAVLRDLEWLLNTHRADEPGAVARRPALRRSLYCYGLPDITSFSRDSGPELARLLREVEAAVAAFEPRLTDVRVARAAEALDRREIRFVIEATLRTEPVAERVAFDAVLEVGSGEYRVRGGSRA
jgi:type VI secretion system protein ImpF